MAGDTQLGAPSPLGAIAATDLIGGAHYQRVKLIHGADGVNDGDASNTNPYPVKFAVASASFGSVQTSGTGATFVPLNAAACIGVEIKNTRPNAVDLAVRRGGAGATVCIRAGGADYFGGITDAAQMQIRRYDTLNTVVDIDYEVRS